MARILIGWELGANRGHVVRCAEIARHLVAAGHEVHAALQNVDGAPALFPDGVRIWQAPMWPRMIVNVAQLRDGHVASMGDILYRMGLDRAEAPMGMIAGWDSLLHAVDPDVAVGDFAPMLALAARGRVRLIACGTGFERVPTGLRSFPLLTGQPRHYDEGQAVDHVNAALSRHGRPLIDALPQLFAADHSLVSTFRALDPYGEWRKERVIAPALGAATPAIAPGGGDEVFVYGFEQSETVDELWQGLAVSALPIRVHVPRATPTLRRHLVDLGFQVEDAPLPFDRIAQRARLVLSHGGHGFVCSSLLAGLPQIILPYDLEKKVHAEGVQRQNLGAQQSLFAVKAEPLADALRRFYHDESLHRRVREAADGFHAQMTHPLPQEILKIVQADGK